MLVSRPDTLHWHTRYLTVGAVRNWARTVITWNLALDPSAGPHTGGCGTCFGVVTIDSQTGKATPTADYYVLGQVTRFVRPGAVQIGSNVAGNIWNVAFRNPDGSIVLLANDDDWGTGSQTFNVRLGANEFSYNLPAGAVAPFVLPGSSWHYPGTPGTPPRPDPPSLSDQPRKENHAHLAEGTEVR